MSETRKLAAILVSDVAGYSRLAGADEERTLARLRALRSDLIDPTIALYHGRIVKRTGDRTIVEFRSVVDAVRLAIEVQGAMVDRNAGVSPDKRIEFRVGIHLGDVVEEGDGDLMGDGVSISRGSRAFANRGGLSVGRRSLYARRQRAPRRRTHHRQAQPCGEIATVVETFRSTDGGDKGRSADPGDRGQPASLFVLLHPPDEFSIEG
jgi:adenylate cyclase